MGATHYCKEYILNKTRKQEPFRLEPAPKPPYHNRSNKRVFFSHSPYNKIVKNHGWQENCETLPHDNKPHDNGKNNLHISHYKRLGQELCHCYSTTTNDMSRDLKSAFIPQISQKKINYYSFISSDCDEKKPTVYPKIGEDNYVSVTHKSYQAPSFYTMKPLVIPKIPFMETRIMKREDRATSKSKFYDEDIAGVIKRLQCYKSHRFNSYNFCTGKYQDGTLPITRGTHGSPPVKGDN